MNFGVRKSSSELTDLLENDFAKAGSEIPEKDYPSILKNYVNVAKNYLSQKDYAGLVKYIHSYLENEFRIHLDNYNQMPESILGMTDKLGNIWMNYKSIMKNAYDRTKVELHEMTHNVIGWAYKMFNALGEEGPVRDRSSTWN